MRGLLLSASAATGAWLLLVAVACDALLFPRRSRRVSAALVVLAAASAVVLPLAWRPVPGPAPAPVPLATETVQPVRRVVLIGLDGLGPRRLRDGVAAGRLPALAQMVKRGAYGPLATLRPTEGPPIWTTVFTGRLPRDHGVKSFATYRLRGCPTAFEALPKGALVGLLERAGLVERTAGHARTRRRRALWNALNAFGIETGVVRFWGTHPPERVQGFMLSHTFHLPPSGPEHVADVLHPRDLLNEVWARVVEPQVVPAQLVSEFVDLRSRAVAATGPGGASWWSGRWPPTSRTTARARCCARPTTRRSSRRTSTGSTWSATRSSRFAEPDRFGDVRPEEVRRYGRVADRYASLLDEWVGETAAVAAARATCCSWSRATAWSRCRWPAAARRRREARRWAARTWTRPTASCWPSGDGVRPGAWWRAASVLDLAPTILYLMGLPVARDMEGRVLTEMLDEEFTRAHPITYIPSYESLAVTPIVGDPGYEPPAPLPDEP